MNIPNIYFFNPTCELAVANSSFSYMPPLLLQEMEQDLAILPFIYANPTDFVLTENQPSANFKKLLTEAGFDLPIFCSQAELSFPSDSEIHALYPWGWSPAAHFILKKFKERCSEEFKTSPVYDWKPIHKTLFERKTSLNLLCDILDKNPREWMINRNLTGKKVSEIDEIEKLLKIHEVIVLKAPLSSSGRGIQIIRKEVLNNSNKQWISGVLKQQKYLIAEPFLDKRMDLSFQFRISNSTIEYLGYSVFETNSNGQYKGTFVHPDLNHILPEAESGQLDELIKSTPDLIKRSMHDSDYARFYEGYIGIDALIFNEAGKLKMQPCIEVNCRMNMGILSLFLADRIHPLSSGKFNLFAGKMGEFKKFAEDQMQANPVSFKDGKICSGFLPLSEPGAITKFGAYTTLGVAK